MAGFRNKKSGYVFFPKQEHESGASHRRPPTKIAFVGLES